MKNETFNTNCYQIKPIKQTIFAASLNINIISDANPFEFNKNDEKTSPIRLYHNWKSRRHLITRYTVLSIPNFRIDQTAYPFFISPNRKRTKHKYLRRKTHTKGTNNIKINTNPACRIRIPRTLKTEKNTWFMTFRAHLLYYVQWLKFHRQ